MPVDAPSAAKGVARVPRKTKLTVSPCSWVIGGQSIGSLREVLDGSVGDCLFLGLPERQHVPSLVGLLIGLGQQSHLCLGLLNIVYVIGLWWCLFLPWWHMKPWLTHPVVGESG